MDITAIGIGAIIGAVITTSVNLYLQQKNLKYDRSKEQLKNLYNPLNAIIKTRKKYLDLLAIDRENFEKFATEYYQFFLDLRDIYLTNEVYASLELRMAFHTVNHNHEVEVYSSRLYKGLMENDEVNKRIALLELRKGKDAEPSEFEQNVEKIIEVISKDMHDLYHGKPVNMYLTK